MATNDFLSVGGGGSANVLTQSAYAALTTFLANGFSSGIVPSNQFNKTLRQTSAIAQLIGQFMVAQGQNANDDGNAATLLTNFQAAVASATGGRTRLQANTNYYVATTGNDTTGNGTSGNPWLTGQKAINYIQQNIDLNGYVATVNFANGTYTTPINIVGAFIGGNATNTTTGCVQILGNSGSPSSVIFSTTNFDAISANYAGCYLQVSGVTLQTSGGGAGGYGLVAYYGASIFVNGPVVFGNCVNGHISAQGGSTVQMYANYTITGSAPTHLFAEINGFIQMNSTTVTLTGTPAFSVAYAEASFLGTISAYSMTFSGSATGARYLVNQNSVINTNGGGATFFPGNSAGSTATGGQYV